MFRSEVNFPTCGITNKLNAKERVSKKAGLDGIATPRRRRRDGACVQSHSPACINANRSSREIVREGNDGLPDCRRRHRGMTSKVAGYSGALTIK